MYDKQKLYTIIHYILFIIIVNFVFYVILYIIVGIKTFYFKAKFCFNVFLKIKDLLTYLM